MTNTVLAVSVSLLLSTNWTGWKRFAPEGDLELGIVETNHMAKVTYEGRDYEFKLKSMPGGIAVWRTNWPVELQAWTNIVWTSTNRLIPGYTNGVYFDSQIATNWLYAPTNKPLDWRELFLKGVRGK